MTTEKLIKQAQEIWKTFSSKALDLKSSIFDQRIVFNIELLGEDEFCLGGDLNQIYLFDNTTFQVHVIYTLDSDDGEVGHDVLICSSTPLVKLNHIILSPFRNQLAMYGKDGIYLMDLSAYKCRSNADSTSSNQVRHMTCRSQTLYKTSQPDYHGVLQVHWYPNREGYLLALTNDDNLRYFNTQLSNCANTMKVIPVKGNKKVKQISPIKFSRALNLNVVDFDFCSQHMLSSESRSTQAEEAEDNFLSVLVLLVCGDVIHISGESVFSNFNDILSDMSNKLSISQNSILKKPGAVKIKRTTLKISPPVEDNYGSDFVSLLCLRGLPNVVVLGTASGQIHHALFLMDTNEDESSSQEHRYTLCVVDRVQLDLPKHEEDIDQFECSILFRQSLYSMNSYVIIHCFGIHAAVLPWLHKLRASYIKPDSTLDLKCLECETVVDFLLCTSPLDQSSFGLPIVGLYEAKSGPRSKLALIICSGEKMEAPMHGEASYVAGNPPYCKKLSNDVSISESTMKESGYENSHNFLTHLTGLLQYDHNIPVFPNSPSEPIVDPECLQKVLGVIRAIQSGHLAHMKEARSVYNKRVQLIKEQIRFQKEECESFDDFLQTMRDCQQNLLVRCKTILISSETFQTRLTSLKLVKGPLSREELIARENIERISSSIKANLKIRLDRVKANVGVVESNSRKTSGEKEKDDSYVEDGSFDYSNNNVTSSVSKVKAVSVEAESMEIVNSLLKEEASRIKKLISKVKTLNEKTASIE